MLPKSSKHFIKPTADQLECNLTLVEDAVGFFYQELRRNLVEMKHPNIQVQNLGSFKAKTNELPKLIAKYQRPSGLRPMIDFVAVVTGSPFHGINCSGIPRLRLAKLDHNR